MSGPRPFLLPDRASTRMSSPRTIRVIAAIVALVFIATVALVVDRHAPAGAWLAHLSAVIAAAQATNANAATTALVLAAFVAATCLGCPVNLGIAACMIALAPLRGFAAAFAGTLASATILHAIGSLVSARRAARWFRQRKALRRGLRRSVLAVALARLLPVAPYAVVSLFAGAMRVPRGRYLAGTALGMTPGILLYAIFVDRAEAVLRSAHAPAAVAAAGALLVVAAIWIACERRASRKRVPR